MVGGRAAVCGVVGWVFSPPLGCSEVAGLMGQLMFHALWSPEQFGHLYIMCSFFSSFSLHTTVS